MLVMMTYFRAPVVKDAEVTTGTARHANVKSNHHHQHTIFSFSIDWMTILLPNRVKAAKVEKCDEMKIE